jgi:hypothetical protein
MAAAAMNSATRRQRHHLGRHGAIGDGAAGSQESAHRLGAGTQRVGRFGIDGEGGVFLLRRFDVQGVVIGIGQDLAGILAPGAAGPVERREPVGHVAARKRIGLGPGGAQARDRADRAAVAGGDVLEQGDGFLLLAGGEHRARLRKPRHLAVALGRAGHHVGKGAGGVLRRGDALGRHEDGGGFFAFLLFVALPQLPGADAQQQDRARNHDVGAIGLPQLLGLLAANVFFDFAENITHSGRTFWKSLTGQVH